MMGHSTEPDAPRDPRPATGSQAGFTLIGLVIVIVLLGVLLVPLLRITGVSLGTARYKSTQAALETARDALIAYAAAHNGCLPYAADYEGSLPDTGKDNVAVPGYADTGFVRKREDKPLETQDVFAGDLPWQELGLGSDFLDGDGLRIQYYVAKPYTTKLLKPGEVGVKLLKQKDRICPAGFRGFEYDETVLYNGTSTEPVFVYYDLSDGIVLAITAPPAGPLTINGSLQDEGGGTFAVVEKELKVTIASTADESGVNFTISGTDKNSNPINPPVVIAGPSVGGVPAVTNQKFLTVTSVVTDAQANGTIEVGMEEDRQLHWIFYNAALAGIQQPGIPDRGGVGIADWFPGYPDTGATKETPIYVFNVDKKGVRELYQIEDEKGKEPKKKVKRSTLLRDPLLEVRRGPDVINGGAAETAVVSAQNVFVLIATGDNRNAAARIKVDGNTTTAPRYYSRDANHVGDKGNDWLIYEEKADGEIKSKEVDKVIFSATRNTGEADEGDNGDDTLLVMSFAEFRAAMSKYGMNMEPVCFEKC